MWSYGYNCFPPFGFPIPQLYDHSNCQVNISCHQCIHTYISGRTFCRFCIVVFQYKRPVTPMVCFFYGLILHSILMVAHGFVFVFYQSTFVFTKVCLNPYVRYNFFKNSNENMVPLTFPIVYNGISVIISIILVSWLTYQEKRLKSTNTIQTVRFCRPIGLFHTTINFYISEESCKRQQKSSWTSYSSHCLGCLCGSDHFRSTNNFQC